MQGDAGPREEDHPGGAGGNRKQHRRPEQRPRRPVKRLEVEVKEAGAGVRGLAHPKHARTTIAVSRDRMDTPWGTLGTAGAMTGID